MKTFLGFCFLLCAPLVFLQGAETKKYDVLWFGDLHYDEMRFHDASKRKYSEHQMKTFRHYTKIWEKFNPPMLKKAVSTIGNNTAFVIHTGDLVQGDSACAEDKDAHVKKALEVVTNGIRIPFYLVKGNHDPRGVGGNEGYCKAILPYLDRQLGKKLESMNYTIIYGKDLYIFADSITPDYEWLEKTLETGKNFRWCFVVAHYPLVPPDTSTRMKFGGEKKAAFLLKLFLKHQVILLCGDAHEFQVVEYAKEKMTFTQVMVNSIMPTKWEKRSVSLENVGRNKKTPDAPNIFQDGLKFFNAYSGGGFAILHVDDENVSIEFYSYKGFDEPKLKTIIRKKTKV